MREQAVRSRFRRRMGLFGQSQSAVRSWFVIALTWTILQLVGSSCRGEASRPRDPIVSDLDGVTLVEPVPPKELSATQVNADWEWGREASVAKIIDLRQLTNGELAVLDGPSGLVWLVDQDTNEERRIGGKGSALGEAANPLALAPLTRGLAIWDAGRRVFNIFDEDGRLIESRSQGDAGDIAAFRGRMDKLLAEDHLRVRSAGEVLWLRLEDNEQAAFTPETRGALEVERQGYITRITSIGVDTLVTYQEATRYLEPGGISRLPAILMPKALWTVNDTLLAYARSDSAEVRIYRYDNHDGLKPQTIFRWPATRERLGVEAKRAHARAHVRENPDNFPDGILDPYRQAEFNAAADRIILADFAPELSAIEIVGACLWVALFDPANTDSGTGRTWAYYNLRSGVGGALTFDTTFAEVMHIGRRHAFARLIGDEFGVNYVRRYPLPGPALAACEM